MTGPRIVIGCDHAAVPLKDEIVAWLKAAGARVEDIGTHSDHPADYPDLAAEIASRVASGAADRGIALCGTGIGMSIAANKVVGIRAALCHDVTTARLARQHNDANVLCLGARTTGRAVALNIVETWLATPFEAGRHAGRVEKIRSLEARAGATGVSVKGGGRGGD